MKNKRASVRTLLATSLPLATVLAVANCYPSRALDAAEDVGVFGSIAVARQAREGAKGIKTGDYTKALNAYRTAIGLNTDVTEFYYGLLVAGQKLEAWDQVNLALDAIAEKDPTAKLHLAYEFGNCYTKTGRYDEAIPMLKAALKNNDLDGAYLHDKIQKLIAMTAAPAPPVVKTQAQLDREKELEEEAKKAAAPPFKPPLHGPDDFNPDKTAIASDYANAFLKSEWIGICEYRGYEKKEGILFNNPPTAHFYWTKCLKGPPLNHDMPIKFKFYENDGVKKPEGWKFLAKIKCLLKVASGLFSFPTRS